MFSTISRRPRSIPTKLFLRRDTHTTGGTTQQRKPYDIVIIGKGPVGLSCAYHCASKGLGRIAVVERDKSFASGSAILSAGGVRQSFSVRENVLMGMFGIEFLKNMKALAVDDEIPDVQLHQHGYLFLANTSSGKQVLEDNNRLQRSCGVDWIDLLTSSQLSNKFPWLNTSDLTLGSYGHDNEGYFDPWSLVHALKRKTMSMGVDFIEGSVVGGRLVESSPSSMSIASVTVRPTITPTPSHPNKSANTDTTSTSTGDQNPMMVSVPAPFELSGGLFINAAGDPLYVIPSHASSPFILKQSRLLHTLSTPDQHPLNILSMPSQYILDTPMNAQALGLASSFKPWHRTPNDHKPSHPSQCSRGNDAFSRY